MAHIPVNHPMRTLYRFLAALAGLYILIFGVVAVAKTHGNALFDQDHLQWVLGLRTNMAFGLISIVAGAIVVVGAIIGRNIDRFINLWGGLFFMVAGMLMLALLRTNANFLGFSMANCVVSFVIGTLLFSAGLYGRTGTLDEAHAEEANRRHHSAPAPGSIQAGRS